MQVAGDLIRVADLPPVARTLLAPLACRARESARPDALIRDSHAEAMLSRFEGGAEGLLDMGPLDQLLVVMRARQMDACARAFLDRSPDGMVVDIGCGLDTRFDRLDNGRMSWLGLDLPEVIGLRRRFLPDPRRCRSLACSMLDLAWLDEVESTHKPAIFLAEGVFPYFTEAEVKQVIMALSIRFPGSELAFDSLTPLSAGLHNRTSALLKDTGSRINWSTGDLRRLEPWGLRLLDKWRYFDRYEPRLGAVNLLRYIPPLNDMNYILHFRLVRRH